MANRVRLRSGQCQLAKMRVLPQTVIESGDLVFVDNGHLFPISKWNRHDHKPLSECFAGVTHQQSAEGEHLALSVDLSPLAIYEFDVLPNDYEVGDELTFISRLGEGIVSSQTLKHCVCSPPTDTPIARAMEYIVMGSGNLMVLRVALRSALFGC